MESTHSQDELILTESMDDWNSWEDVEAILNLSHSSSFSSRRSSSFSSVTICSEFTPRRHIGAPEIEEIPDYRWLPFTPSGRVTAPETTPTNILNTSGSQSPARGRKIDNTKTKREIQPSIGGIRRFSSKQIKKATNNFDRGRLIKENHLWMIFKGTMPEFQQSITIKAPKVRERESISFMLNEISIISRVNHKNFANLIGVCLEKDEGPYSVFEFFPRETLYANIIQHGRLPWEKRLKIAFEIAEALTFLHSLLPTPVIHRGIKACNIYLDGDDTPKIFDFWMAKFEASSEDYFTVAMVARNSYLDPGYFRTSFTCKTDVYSFGFLLAHLLTSCKHLHFEKPEERRYLIRHFTMKQMFDREILNADTFQMKLVAQLVGKCLETRSEHRPSMGEVTAALKQIKNSDLFFPLVNPDNQSNHVLDRRRN